MDDNQNFYITPPTIFMPPGGLRVALMGTDTDWVDELTEELEETLSSVPMTFYHLDEKSTDQWQWLYMMTGHADLLMVNVAKASTNELLTAFLHLGNKTWFFVEPEKVNNELLVLLNNINANVFSNTEELGEMMRVFINNG
jgi:hypothetical protein